MLKFDVRYEAGDAMTPDFAARLAQEASCFASRISLKSGSFQLGVESLIGIMAMDMRRGGEVTVIVDGADEAEAGMRICKLLSGH